MNRKKFVLSWGRRVFFGMSWPVSCVLALLYLKSFILPHSASEFLYFLTTLVGQFGLFTAIIYFVFYCPVVQLFPSYYVSRIWSLLLVVSINMLILVDATVFSTYHLHIYNFIAQLLVESGLSVLPDFSVLKIAIPSVLIALTVLLWIRGELIWRSMQRRFSNPIKNWYLALILLCLIVSKTIFYLGNIHPQIGTLFPLDFNITKTENLRPTHSENFYYPLAPITCSGSGKKNLLVLVIKEWDKSELNAETMPHLVNMMRHAEVFNQHYSVAKSAGEGLFGLNFSIPASYQLSAEGRDSALMLELTKRQYEIINLGTDGATEKTTFQNFLDWANHHSEDLVKPYYLNITYNRPSLEVDSYIHEMVNLLQEKELLSGTQIIITGGTGTSGKFEVPFLLMTTDRKHAEFEHPTSHYDVFPTIMEKTWGCKKTYELASVGKPLYTIERDWLFISGADMFKIFDYRSGISTSVTNGKITDLFTKENQKPDRGIIFEALKLNTRFTKPK